jgi:hypothetical protein
MPGPLAAFAPLLGHCFLATLSPGVVDRHCFSEVWNGAHVRDVHVVTSHGKQVYAGETVYSFDGKRIEITYFNSIGGVGHGVAVAADKMIGFEGTMLGSPDAKPRSMAARWTIDRRSYVVASDGKTIRFVRER